jgi:hypothetical protein
MQAKSQKKLAVKAEAEAGEGNWYEKEAKNKAASAKEWQERADALDKILQRRTAD